MNCVVYYMYNIKLRILYLIELIVVRVRIGSYENKRVGGKKQC